MGSDGMTTAEKLGVGGFIISLLGLGLSIFNTVRSYRREDRKDTNEELRRAEAEFSAAYHIHYGSEAFIDPLTAAIEAGVAESRLVQLMFDIQVLSNGKDVEGARKKAEKHLAAAKQFTAKGKR